MYNYSPYISGQNTGDNPFQGFCPYCKSNLVITEIDDCWNISEEQILAAHAITSDGYKELHDLEDCYLDLKLDTQDITVRVHYCWTCGWWRLLKQICVCAREWQIWDIQFGCSGILQELNLQDIDSPLEEVKNFITRHYDKRFLVHHFKFQDLVTSVFKNLGYNILATAYMNDGGVDVVMTDSNGQKIGVQVKRYKDLIEVEQIRAFVGALFLKDLTKGIFVTTSGFQSGITNLKLKAALKGIPIELIDAKKFYDALKIVQLNKREKELLPFDINNETITNIDFYGWDTPRNSL